MAEHMHAVAISDGGRITKLNSTEYKCIQYQPKQNLFLNITDMKHKNITRFAYIYISKNTIYLAFSAIKLSQS